MPRYRRSSTKNNMLPRYLFPTALLATCLISSSHAFVPASKVPPAEPTAAVSSSSTDAILKLLSARGSSSSSTSVLQMAKKKKAPAASNKIQVKMLKYVEGTGSVSGFFVTQTHVLKKLSACCVPLFYTAFMSLNTDLLRRILSIYLYRSATLSW